MSVSLENPVQPVLDLPLDPVAWQRCAGLVDPAARWRTYLHQIGAVVLFNWLQEEFELPVQIWPAAAPFDIWHVVDGLGLILGHKRLVVLLSEAIDAAELRVPQEWVDIPEWVADYYIAAYVDIDEQQLIPWAYTTYAHLKSAGTYASSDRTYSLAEADLVQDFSAFWVAQQVEQPVSVGVEALPAMSAVQAENLIQRLASVPAPRLAIPFAQWGALLSHDAWRQQLYRRRQGQVPIDLGRWTQQYFDHGWQALESLLSRPPALAFRSETPLEAAVVRGKRIPLPTPTGEVQLALALAVNDESAARRQIRIQLHPIQEDVLPAGVQIALFLPDREEPLQTVQASDRDTYIQLPPFRCPVGRSFRVDISSAAGVAREDFIS